MRERRRSLEKEHGEWRKETEGRGKAKGEHANVTLLAAEEVGLKGARGALPGGNRWAGKRRQEKLAGRKWAAAVALPGRVVESFLVFCPLALKQGPPAAYLEA